MGLIGDHIYQCACGSRKFVELYQVKKWAGGGRGKITAGFRCMECDAEMDGKGLSRSELKQQAEQKMREARQLMAQIGEDDGSQEEDGKPETPPPSYVDG